MAQTYVEPIQQPINPLQSYVTPQLIANQQAREYKMKALDYMMQNQARMAQIQMMNAWHQGAIQNQANRNQIYGSAVAGRNGYYDDLGRWHDAELDDKDYRAALETVKALGSNAPDEAYAKIGYPRTKQPPESAYQPIDTSRIPSLPALSDYPVSEAQSFGTKPVSMTMPTIPPAQPQPPATLPMMKPKPLKQIADEQKQQNFMDTFSNTTNQQAFGNVMKEKNYSNATTRTAEEIRHDKEMEELKRNPPPPSPGHSNAADQLQYKKDTQTAKDMEPIWMSKYGLGKTKGGNYYYKNDPTKSVPDTILQERPTADKIALQRNKNNIPVNDTNIRMGKSSDLAPSEVINELNTYLGKEDAIRAVQKYGAQEALRRARIASQNANAQ